MDNYKYEFIKGVFIDDLSKRDSNGSHVLKTDIIRIAEEYGIKFNKRGSKEGIVQKIIEAGFYDRLFNDFREFIYIPSWVIAKYYKFSNGEKIDQLKQIGTIKEESVRESFYSRDSKRDVYYNAYPISVLDYKEEELKKAYDLAFGKYRYKLRLETETTEEIPRVTTDLKKVFVIVGDKPTIYEHRDKSGYYSYYNIELLNNSHQEQNRLLIEIEELKKKLQKQDESYREKIESINKKWCDKIGVSSYMEASNNMALVDYYKQKVASLENKLEGNSNDK